VDVCGHDDAQSGLALLKGDNAAGDDLMQALARRCRNYLGSGGVYGATRLVSVGGIFPMNGRIYLPNPPPASLTVDFQDVAENTRRYFSRAAFPDASQILSGVSYQNGEATGTFDEAARNTDPGESNVFAGTSYKIQNAAKTGTFDEAARNTDPGVANPADVRLGVATDASVGTCAVPTPDYVMFGVPVDDTVGTGSSMSEAAEDLLQDIYDRIVFSVPEGPAAVVPAPGVGQTTVWAMCYDEEGQPESGVTLTVQCVKAEDPGAFDSVPVVLTSDETGLAAGAIPRGAGLRFQARRGTGKWVRFQGADSDSLELPNLLGD
jgi:hypothetical protein